MNAKTPKKGFGTTQIVAMAVGTALYAALNVFFNVLQLPGTQLVSLRPSVSIPMFFGYAAFTDYIFGYGISTLEEAIYALFLPAAVTDAVNGAILTPLLVAAYYKAAAGRARRA